MFPNNNTVSKIVEIISKNNAGVIILPVNPSVDALAAGISLYFGLTKLGKNISLACSSAVKSEMIGVDKIQSNLTTSGDNLIISFPYADGSVDKVNYNIQGDYFNLIVTPRQGFSKLEPNQVKYSYTGGSIDFIITIDAPNLNSLGHIYTDNQQQYQGKNIINIDRHLTNSFFGTVNFINKTSSSTSELVLKILQGLNSEIDKDMATNLYAGLLAATNNFTSYSVGAETFETASYLLKLGALKKTAPARQPIEPTFIPQQSSAVFDQSMPPSIRPLQPSVKPQTNIQATNQPTQSEKQNDKPIGMVEKEVRPEETAPQDWLKPKIFRGGGLI